MRKPFVYSIWLVPCTEQRNALEQLVCDLSVRFGTPSFAPHATLCSGRWNREERLLLNVFQQMAAQTAPIELKVDGIEWTNHWSTFFFLSLSGADDFFECSAALVEGSHPPPVGPHLSLLYGLNPPQSARAALRQELAGRLPAAIRFDALELVRTATGRWEDVKCWEIIRSANLAG